MANKVWKTGHIVIEKPIRDERGIKPGWLATQQLVAGHIVIHFSPPEHIESPAKSSTPPASEEPE